MVSEREMEGGKTTNEAKPVVLSEGASVALGSVFNRIIKPRAGEAASKSTGKRPRPTRTSVVLTANDQVQEELQGRKKEKKKYKDARKAKLQFESNGRIIPDAATNAAMEKDLLATATKGAVALFNAVSKAQKAAEEAANQPKKSGTPISRNSFMDMMRAGVTKDDTIPSRQDADDDSDSDEGSEAPKSKAKWLKDDFLTARSKTLRDWDRKAPDGDGLDSSEDDDEELDSSGTNEQENSENSDAE